MTEKRFEVAILERYCKGCGLCVQFCEQGKLAIDPHPNKRGVQPAVVKPDAVCKGCLQCAVVCADAAVEVMRVDVQVSSADAPARK